MIELSEIEYKLIEKIREAGYTCHIFDTTLFDYFTGRKRRGPLKLISSLPFQEIGHNFFSEFSQCVITTSRTILRAKDTCVYLYPFKKFASYSREGNVFQRAMSLIEDSNNRNFTIEGIYYDPIDNLLYDYHGGLAHLSRFMLKPIVAYDTAVEADTSLVMKSIALASKYQLRIDEGINLVNEHYGDKALLDIPSGHVRKYLVDSLSTDGVESLYDIGILSVLIPEIKTTYDFTVSRPFTNSENYLFNHIIATLDYLHIRGTPSTEVKLAALLHCISLPKDGFDNYANKSAYRAKEILTGLEFDGNIVSKAALLIQYQGLACSWNLYSPETQLYLLDRLKNTYLVHNKITGIDQFFNDLKQLGIAILSAKGAPVNIYPSQMYMKYKSSKQVLFETPLINASSIKNRFVLGNGDEISEVEIKTMVKECRIRQLMNQSITATAMGVYLENKYGLILRAERSALDKYAGGEIDIHEYINLIPS